MRWRRRGMVFVLSLLAGVVLLDTLLWAIDYDWKVYSKVFRGLSHEPSIHQPSADARLLYELKPGASGSFTAEYGEYFVSINKLGFRGKEHPARKPPGVFRIFCVGGSNVYGAELSDMETWPAKLERNLEIAHPGRYEVWNLGVCGYNPLQMAVIAQKALDKYQPDLILFSLSNWGARYFLTSTPNIKEFFDRDPSLWLDVLSTPEPDPPSLEALKLAMMRLSALYRTVEIYRFGLRNSASPPPTAAFPHHVAAAREFLTQAKRRTRVGIFFCPAVANIRPFKPIYQGLDIPMYRFVALGKAPPYLKIHPPAFVMEVYAKNLEEWLRQAHLISD
jgi:hypothetical protein